jgi:hypothetical protein
MRSKYFPFWNKPSYTLGKILLHGLFLFLELELILKRCSDNENVRVYIIVFI